MKLFVKNKKLYVTLSVLLSCLETFYNVYMVTLSLILYLVVIRLH
jgi:hypothetical protein